MAVYTRPHKRKLIKRSRTLPVYGEGDDEGKYFRCCFCGWICNVDRDELGDSESSSGNEHTDYHETHHCSTYGEYDGTIEPIGPEILINGGFELDNPPDSWTVGNSADLDRHADPNTGTYCLEINENSADNPYTYQEVGAEAGRKYRFCFYVKQGTGTSWQAYVYDVQNSANLCPIGYFGYATSSYVQHKLPLVIPADCYSVRAVLQHMATSGDGTTVLFDDVSLKEVGIHRSVSKYATLGGDIGHYQVAVNVDTPDEVAKIVKHEYTSDISRGCPFCGSTNWRGDY